MMRRWQLGDAGSARGKVQRGGASAWRWNHEGGQGGDAGNIIGRRGESGAEVMSVSMTRGSGGGGGAGDAADPLRRGARGGRSAAGVMDAADGEGGLDSLFPSFIHSSSFIHPYFISLLGLHPSAASHLSLASCFVVLGLFFIVTHSFFLFLFYFF